MAIVNIEYSVNEQLCNGRGFLVTRWENVNPLCEMTYKDQNVDMTSGRRRMFSRFVYVNAFPRISGKHRL
jgi:hypothetical protein